MKKIKTFIVTLASFMLALFMMVPSTAMADEMNNTYKVRIYAGNEGTFAGGATRIEFEAPRGSVVNVWAKIGDVYMNPAEDALKNTVDNKYHVLGIRKAGRDNVNDNKSKAPVIAKGGVFTVKEDIDFVVAYGIEGGDVPYTVKYINEETGEKLADDDVFYGNAGDRPVVAFKFFDGMLPQAYNLTGTLKAAPEVNEFTFKYRPGDTSELRTIFIDGDTTIQYIDGEAIDRGLVGDGGGATGNAGTTGTAGGTTDTTTTAPSVNEGNVTYAAGGSPASLIDIDDGTTPLASFGPGFDYDDQLASQVGLKQMPNAMKIGLGCMLAVIIGGIAFLVVSMVRRKKQRAE